MNLLFPFIFIRALFATLAREGARAARCGQLEGNLMPYTLASGTPRAPPKTVVERLFGSKDHRSLTAVDWILFGERAGAPAVKWCKRMESSRSVLVIRWVATSLAM